MSQPPTGPTGSEPNSSEDISSAFAAARHVASERRLAVFLKALSSNTLRLSAYDSEECREALTQATISVWALLTSASNIPSEEEVNRWSPRVHLLLILESLERGGFIQVDHGEIGHKPLSAEPLIRVIGKWTELL